MRRAQNRTKKKLPALDKYLVFSFAIMLIYALAEFIVSTITGVSHDTLTTCIFAAFGGELLMLCMIKRLKLRKESSE